MKDVLLEGNLLKKIQKISNQKAKLEKKEAEAVGDFLAEIDPADLEKIFKIIEENGHPNEKNECQTLKDKYQKGLLFNVDDLIKLDNLYKTNAKNFSKESPSNE